MKVLLVMLFSLVILSCSNNYTSGSMALLLAGSSQSPDYADLRYWAAHPRKRNPADSVPAPLRNQSRDTIADVFFMHPTTYTDKKAAPNADLSNEALNIKTDQTTILYQATAFNQHARIFAPRYRQAHLSAFYIRDTAAFETAYADLRDAFRYYLEHENHGRPIIIAAHSQGAFLAIRLLKEFFDGKPLQKQLVAAYIIGWPVLQHEFAQLRPCADSSATGCIISWRTFRKGYIPDYVQQEKAAVVTNPLNWKTDTTYASSLKNNGSVLRDFNKITPHTTDAQVHGNVLWVSKPKFPGSLFFTTKNYHIADINLFYINIRQNVAYRLRIYTQLKH
jgi:hypothetical protein